MPRCANRPAGQFFPRGTIIGAGCVLWATMTALFATCTSLRTAIPVCAINGVGLALVIPNVQSLTADYYHATSRGRAFGALWLVISVGGMLGALYATNMGEQRISSASAAGNERPCGWQCCRQRATLLLAVLPATSDPAAGSAAARISQPPLSSPGARTDWDTGAPARQARPLPRAAPAFR